MTNFDRFAEAYLRNLYKAIEAYPKEYAYSTKSAEVVAIKMMAAIKRGSYSKDSRAIKATCKELGIKYTYSGIKEYINAA